MGTDKKVKAAAFPREIARIDNVAVYDSLGKVPLAQAGAKLIDVLLPLQDRLRRNFPIFMDSVVP
jgi:hypothetical protein